MLFNKLQKLIISNTRVIFLSRMYSGKGTPLPQVVKAMEEIAPSSIAETWDNVGLLVEPSSPHHINKVMLTNDLTESVLEEAISNVSNMVISYHPPLFTAFKRLSGSKWKDRIVVRAIENRIAIYSPHTSCDAVVGGVNDWMLEPFQGKKQFLDPDPNQTHGMGRICYLSTPLTLSDIVKKSKEHFNVSYIRIGKSKEVSLETMISSIAVCAGSGSSVLRGVEADLYITGEMSHHEVLDAVSCGKIIILCEHSNTERGYLLKLRKEIELKLENQVEVCVSITDADPLSVL